MADTNDDFLQFVSEDIVPDGKKVNHGSWKIIVADDDSEVHAVTALALSNFLFKDVPLEILSSYSAEETEQMILDNPDTAVILLDVVMENHDSGLQLVKFIRETAENKLVRIILRTGQPGYAPELEVISEYDINDYKEKTELTSSKLVTTLISSIRNFDDLRRIEESRQSLALVAASSASIHGLDSPTPIMTTISETLSEVLLSFDRSGIDNISILNGTFTTADVLNVKGGTGIYSDLRGDKNLDSLVSDEIHQLLNKNNLTENIFFNGNSCAAQLLTRRGEQRLIYINEIPELNDMKKSILQAFFLNISTVYSNIELLNEQKKTEEEIRKSLEEKLILVKEIHHRVKNNLQIISSLLHMQTSRTTDPKLLDVLKESEDRVQSMSLVHEKLYQSDMMATINFTEYISSLAERLISSYSVTDNIQLRFETDRLMLSINTAIPCGLIVNEILTNSIKYAFPENRNGEILISLKAINEKLILHIRDNGIGLPENLDITKIKSLGMKLIQVLADQIDGELEIISEMGTAYTLSFSEMEERES